MVCEAGDELCLLVSAAAGALAPSCALDWWHFFSRLPILSGLQLEAGQQRLALIRGFLGSRREQLRACSHQRFNMVLVGRQPGACWQVDPTVVMDGSCWCWGGCMDKNDLPCHAKLATLLCPMPQLQGS